MFVELEDSKYPINFSTPGVYPLVGDIKTKEYAYVYRLTGNYRAWSPISREEWDRS